MKLRTRLFVTSLGVAIPLALVVFAVNERLRLTDMEQNLRRSIESPALQGALGQCEPPDTPPQ